MDLDHDACYRAIELRALNDPDDSVSLYDPATSEIFGLDAADVRERDERRGQLPDAPAHVRLQVRGDADDRPSHARRTAPARTR